MNKIVVVNLKMKLTFEENEQYINYIKNKINFPQNVIICPSSIYIYMFKGNEYKVGSQNVFIIDRGSYTGEISPLQLKSFGIKYTIVGHSERRIYFNEDDNLIEKKLIASLKQNIKPILCVGETIEEKKLNRTIQVLKRQLNILKNVTQEELVDILIAYEPIWAVGSGKTPSLNEIEETVIYIKEYIQREYNVNLKVLYGGSINESNIKEIITINNIDGILIGSAASEPNKLINILDIIVKLK